MNEQDALLEKCAKRIVELRLETPALFFLEAHKPLTTLFHTGTLMLAPIASPLFGAERIHSLQTFLAERKNVERLIELIEEN